MYAAEPSPSSACALPTAPHTRLVWGTAGIGQAYGLPDGGGVLSAAPSDEELERLINDLHRIGVDTLDTAPAYGSTESRLGGCPGLGCSAESGFAIWSKFSPSGSNWSAAVLSSLTASCTDLRRERLDLAQWHNWRRELLDHPKAVRLLTSLRESGIAAEIGATTYGTADAEAAYRSGLFDVVQVEWNLLNPAVVRHLVALPRRRTRIAVRSVLLQGLLAGRPVPRHLESLRAAIAGIKAVAAARSLPVSALALRAALDEPGIHHVLIGLDRAEQLDGIRGALDAPPLSPGERTQLAACERSGSADVDPRNWRAA